jgi:hypothetical protein
VKLSRAINCLSLTLELDKALFLDEGGKLS